MKSKLNQDTNTTSEFNIADLVEYSVDSKRYIVLVTGGGDYEDTFSGIVIYSNFDDTPIGYVSNFFGKNVFVDFLGKLEISN